MTVFIKDCAKFEIHSATSLRNLIESMARRLENIIKGYVFNFRTQKAYHKKPILKIFLHIFDLKTV
jgi:hypothetical protein